MNCLKISLQKFAVAYRLLDSRGLRESLQTISSSLSLRLQTNLADALLGSLSKINDIVGDEQKSGDDIPGGAYRTLNMPIYVDFMCRIEEMGRWVGAGEITLIHDETKEFQDTYEWLLRTFKNAKRVDICLPNGRVIPMGFQTLSYFKTMNSVNEPMIQAADLLARSLCAFAIDVKLGRPMQEGLVKIATILLPATMMEPQFGGLIASSRFMRNLLEPIFR